jgi:hypothetical protein
MRTVKALLLVLPLWMGAFATSGCYAREVYVASPPPPPAYPVAQERVPSQPGPEYAWVRGHWAWAGGGYRWIYGQWIRRPSAVAIWEPGRWRHEHHGWVWIEAHWRT